MALANWVFGIGTLLHVFARLIHRRNRSSQMDLVVAQPQLSEENDGIWDPVREATPDRLRRISVYDASSDCAGVEPTDSTHGSVCPMGPDSLSSAMEHLYQVVGLCAVSYCDSNQKAGLFVHWI